LSWFKSVVFAVVVAAHALTQIAPHAIQISKGIAAAQELFGIIDRKSDIDSLSTEGSRPAECNGEIELSNVHFAYPSRPSVPVLQDFTLSIPANRTTALVGSSGSGKSTIVGLIERWYSPTSGSITLDGHDIKDLNVEWLRTNIRLVQQVWSEWGLDKAILIQKGTYTIQRHSISECVLWTGWDCDGAHI